MGGGDRGDRAAVHGDRLASRVGRLAEGRDAPVDGDPARGDQRVARRAGWRRRLPARTLPRRSAGTGQAPPAAGVGGVVGASSAGSSAAASGPGASVSMPGPPLRRVASAARPRPRRGAGARRGWSGRTARGSRRRCRTGTAGPGASARPSSTTSRRWSRPRIAYSASTPRIRSIGRLRDGLPVGDDRERLERRRRQAGRLRDRRSGRSASPASGAVTSATRSPSTTSRMPRPARLTSRSPSRALTVSAPAPVRVAISRRESGRSATNRRASSCASVRSSPGRPSAGRPSPARPSPGPRRRRPLGTPRRRAQAVLLDGPLLVGHASSAGAQPAVPPPTGRGHRSHDDGPPRRVLLDRRSRAASRARASRGT